MTYRKLSKSGMALRLLLGFTISFSQGCGKIWASMSYLNNFNAACSVPSWKNVDDYAPTGTNSVGHALATDSANNLYSAGTSTVGFSASWIIKKSNDHGVTWQVLDTYTVTGTTNSPEAIFIDSLGNIFVVGGSFNTSFQYTWLVRASYDQGATWANVDSYIYPAMSGNYISAYEIGTDTGGDLFVVGVGEDASTNEHWIVRKSTDHGTTWATADDYRAGTSSQFNLAFGFARDLSGNLYVSGSGQDNSNNSYWIVRKSTDNGATWTNVDFYSYPGGTSTVSGRIKVDLNNNLYSAGTYQIAGVLHVLVRKSSDLGVTWANVNDFVYPGGYMSPHELFIDLHQNVYMIGYAIDAGSNYHFFSRKSLDGGYTWITIDDYIYPGGTSSYGNALLVDAQGNLYAIGSGIDGASNNHWLVREFSCF